MFEVGRLGWEVETFPKTLLSVDFTISINIFSNWKGVTDEMMAAARCSHQMSFPTTGIRSKRHPIHAGSSPATRGQDCRGGEAQGAFGEVGASTKDECWEVEAGWPGTSTGKPSRLAKYKEIHTSFSNRWDKIP